MNSGPRIAGGTDRAIATAWLENLGYLPHTDGWTETALLAVVSHRRWQHTIVRDDWGCWRASVVQVETGWRETCHHADRSTALLIAVASMAVAYPPEEPPGSESGLR